MLTAQDIKAFVLGFAALVLMVACWFVVPLVLIEYFGNFELATSVLLSLLAFVLLALGAFGCLYMPLVNQWLRYEEASDLEHILTGLALLVWPFMLLLLLAFENNRMFFDPPQQR